MSVTQELMDLAAKTFGVDGSTLRPEDDFFQTLQIESIQAFF